MNAYKRRQAHAQRGNGHGKPTTNAAPASVAIEEIDCVRTELLIERERRVLSDQARVQSELQRIATDKDAFRAMMGAKYGIDVLEYQIDVDAHMAKRRPELPPPAPPQPTPAAPPQPEAKS